MNLTVEPHIFDRLALGWLIVPGACECRSCLYGNTNHTPPADLVALVGKACEACGTGHELLTVTTECDEIECPVCLGAKGVWTDDAAWTCRKSKSEFYTLGTRSVRVRLTGDPLPIVRSTIECVDSILVARGGFDWKGSKPARAFQYRPGSGRSLEQVDLGPNPVALIGMWAFPVEVVT
jgi:hypothetical protein